MHLVQILLPLPHDQGRSLDPGALDVVTRELTEAFGGVTAYLRSPAAGAWAQDGRVERDQVVMVEVMTETLDRGWWDSYRRELEGRFQQEVIVIRATLTELL